jgi:hypothetical protein
MEQEEVTKIRWKIFNGKCKKCKINVNMDYEVPKGKPGHPGNCPLCGTRLILPKKITNSCGEPASGEVAYSTE